MRVLCVAEKPSVAKSVSQILSADSARSRDSPVRYIKNWDFQYRLPGVEGWADFTMTSVAGHLTETDFEQEYRGWHGCEPFALFEAPIKREVSKDHKGTERNLLNEARHAQRLMIWTDCDREGEHIGSEIVTVCRRANRDILVQRARFSAIIPNQIHNACKNPGQLDWKQAAAVEARIDLDLRIGSAFTRTQTLGLKTVHPDLEDMLISYGPCQFPCLGFVVDRYEQILAFIPESFWYIHVAVEKDGCDVTFNWKRVRLFDREVVKTILELMEEDLEAEVLEVKDKPTKKWKPLPLTTVELQKAGSRLLHLAPKRVLDIAESLYQKGYVSYPRTETDQFDPQFNFMELIEKQTVDEAWGQFATMLKDGGYERPKNGSKNDKAHPPIHPTSHVSNLTGDDKKVYEFITRRYLACCSKNALGNETVVEISIGEEQFSAKGLIVLERNYLDVYPYDKWEGNHIPDFTKGEKFIPDVCEMKHGRTTKPSLLTEADLVSLMDKNGIGTDATIGEHIAKIIERLYVMKHKEGRIEYLSPSTLGIGLVRGYNQVGLEKSLSKPQLRRETELRMVQVCEGTKSKAEMIAESLEEYKDVFMRAKRSFNVIANEVLKYLEGRGDGQPGAAAPDGDGGGGGRR
ncbi:prokaryotic type I DNA topoisomerase, partial [Atractiella rhizophila]